MKKVQILMSTYNGEKYLEQQLDSILNQTYSEICILIRDDGSTDHTIDILKRYSDQYEQITYVVGENVGVVQSFLTLLKCSDLSADYFALADQDDVWDARKVECAVRMLQQTKEDVPMLYCSDLNITDEQLNVLKKTDKAPRHPDYGNALVQNICTGCTAVINRSLCNIVNRTSPQHIIMHDWWLYITAAIYGKICYDNNAYISYRQHDGNVYGMKKSKKEVWRYRFQQLLQKRGKLYPQLQEVQKWYPDMPAQYKHMLEKTLRAKHGLINKMKLIMDRKIYRNSREDDLVYRGIVLIGKL